DGLVRPASRRRGSTTGPNTGGIGPKASLNHPIGSSDGRCPDKSLHQLRTAMHHYPLNQERALDLSILTVFGTGDFATILPPEPKHFGFPEAAQRVIKRTSPNRWLASFTVTTRAVSDRLRTSNFRSFATILPPEPKHFGFPEAAQRVIKRTSPNRWLASFTVTTRAVSDRLRTSNFRS
ncbi:hypothetical protein M514_28111, partial [Trichuris suis]